MDSDDLKQEIQQQILFTVNPEHQIIFNQPTYGGNTPNQLQGKLTIKTITSSIVCIKIQANNPQNYQVKPSKKVCHGQEEYVVDFYMKDSKLAELSGDKFLIQAVVMLNDKQDITKIWNQKDKIFRKTMQVFIDKQAIKKYYTDSLTKSEDSSNKNSQIVQSQMRMQQKGLNENDQRVFKSQMDYVPEKEMEYQQMQQQQPDYQELIQQQNQQLGGMQQSQNDQGEQIYQTIFSQNQYSQQVDNAPLNQQALPVSQADQQQNTEQQQSAEFPMVSNIKIQDNYEGDSLMPNQNKLQPENQKQGNRVDFQGESPIVSSKDIQVNNAQPYTNFSQVIQNNNQQMQQSQQGTFNNFDLEYTSGQKLVKKNTISQICTIEELEKSIKEQQDILKHITVLKDKCEQDIYNLKKGIIKDPIQKQETINEHQKATFKMWHSILVAIISIILGMILSK